MKNIFGIFGNNSKVYPHSTMNNCTKISKPVDKCFRNWIWVKDPKNTFIARSGFLEVVPSPRAGVRVCRGCPARTFEEDSNGGGELNSTTTSSWRLAPQSNYQWRVRNTLKRTNVLNTPVVTAVGILPEIGRVRERMGFAAVLAEKNHLTLHMEEGDRRSTRTALEIFSNWFSSIQR